MQFAMRFDGAKRNTQGRQARSQRLLVACQAIVVGAALVMLSLSARSVRAGEASYTATVDASHVHVRSGPGREYYPTEILRRGERVEVCGLDAGGWCRVRPPGGSFSLIAADAVEVERDGSARVVTDDVEVHVGSRFGDSRDVVQVRLGEGDRVELLSEQPRDAGESTGAWFKIAPPHDEFRWIHEQFLHAEPNPSNRDLAASAADNPPPRFAADELQRASYEQAMPEPRLLGDVVGASPITPPLAAYDSRPVATVLDDLELQVAARAAGETPTRSLATLETDAQDAWRRAQTASDRNRADILVRRVGRLKGRQSSAASAPTASHAVYNEPLPGVPNVPQPNLGPLSARHGFVDLVQYFSPQVAGPMVPPYPPNPSSCAPPAGLGYPGGAVGPGYMRDPYASPYASPTTRHYVNLDALGFWVQKDNLPALATASPVGTPQAVAGILGQPSTSVIIGNQSVNGGIRPGGRVQGGVWLVDGEVFAIEGHYWALATASTTFSASSTFSTGATTDPILARPFFNDAPLVNAQDRVIVAFPNFVVSPIVMLNIDGSIQVRESSNIQSAGGGGRLSLSPYSNPTRFFVVGGYRFFELSETLSIVSISTPGTAPYPPGTRLTILDNFATNNIFNGGDLGLGAEFRMSRWSLAAETRLALGNMHEVLMINGAAMAQTAGFSLNAPGGLLAQPTNIGDFSRNRFALIPQVDVKLGYQLARALRLTVGYNFTWVSRVLRPGSQVDTNVNGSQIGGGALVGPASPTILWNESGLWLQGATAGFELTF